MDAIDIGLHEFIDSYISLEKTIQRLVAPFARRYCGQCSGKCCREEICRESIESPFLSVLVKRQKVRYDSRKGWLGAAGCRLAYGRPLVCYDYFCEDILNRRWFQTSPARAIIRGFVSVGNRAHGTTHLVCVADLDILSPRKIEKLCDKIRRVLDTAVRALPPAETG